MQSPAPPPPRATKSEALVIPREGGMRGGGDRHIKVSSSGSPSLQLNFCLLSGILCSTNLRERRRVLE